MIKKYHAVLFTGCASMLMKPFGAHKVAHELRLNGFDTLVVNYVDLWSIQELKQILDHCISDQTLFVGISNTFLNYNTVNQGSTISVDPSFYQDFLPQGTDAGVEFAAHVRKLNPQCKIVTGGTRTHANYNNKIVDYAVIGYADISTVQLAQFLQSQKPIAVRNYRNIYGITVIEDAVAENFDFNNSSMTWCDDDIVIPEETLPLEISRGCIFSCKFCSYRLNGKQSLDYLKHSHIIEQELLYNYHTYGITKYRLLDDTFNDTEEKIDAIHSIVKRLPFQPVFGGYARLDLLAAKPHTVKKLFDLGFRHMYFGIETFNRQSGSIVGKGGDPDRMIRLISEMKKTYGDDIALYGSFICGLPGESKTSVLDTMKKLINGDIALDMANYYPLGIWKKSAHQWESSFDLDYQSYGYRELETRTGHNSSLVNWQNDHMNYYEAVEMITNFTKLYRPKITTVHNQLFGKLYNNKSELISLYKTHLFNYLTHVQS